MRGVAEGTHRRAGCRRWFRETGPTGFGQNACGVEGREIKNDLQVHSLGS